MSTIQLRSYRSFQTKRRDPTSLQRNCHFLNFYLFLNCCPSCLRVLIQPWTCVRLHNTTGAILKNNIEQPSCSRISANHSRERVTCSVRQQQVYDIRKERRKLRTRGTFVLLEEIEKFCISKRRKGRVFATGGIYELGVIVWKKIWVGLRSRLTRKWLILSLLQPHCNRNLPRKMVSRIMKRLSTVTNKNRRRLRLRMIAAKC